MASPTGYCTPANTFYDPPDVPEDGSTVVPTKGVRSSRITVQGLSTPLLESGPKRAREAVVFVHGNPASSQDWLPFLPRVGSRGIRALAFDFPGFGHADKPRDYPYTTEGFIRFFGRALDKLDVRRVHLVAHDIGTLALFWAGLHPQRIASVVLLNAGLPIGYEHHGLAQIWRTPEVGETFMAGFNRELFAFGVNSGQERPLPRSYIDRVYDDYDRATRCAVLDLYRSFVPNDQITEPALAAARALRHDDRERPALVIWGRNDPYFPVRSAERQRIAFPEARVKIFEDSGHWPFVDSERRTRKLVVPFLAQQFR